MITEIPNEPLRVPRNNGGFMPVELHCRDGIYFQESSYGHFKFCAILTFAAIVIFFLPWNTLANNGVKLKYFVGGGILWGGICGLVPYFIRNGLGQHIIIDPQKRTLHIAKSSVTIVAIDWEQIVGLQICHEKVPKDYEMDGFQLNLVWHDALGSLQRHCLVKHENQHPILKLGKKYEELFGFRMFNQIK